MDANFYINWLLYAVLGRTGEADGLMEQYRKEIYQTANGLRAAYRTPAMKLFRGMLLEPAETVGGELPHDDRLKFLSFSKNRDVARWFADVNSIMSGYVAQKRPLVRGYMIEHAAAARDVLFDADWAKEGTPLLYLLNRAARLHPHINEAQFAWNLKTQQEVILKPVEHLKTVPYEGTDTKVLDDRFAMPQFR